ncbi:MAG: serine/threonine protein kinase [Candidatus Obscuribacterales bacterium]|nr:serine/threonine protein kinase [Candidatus Obscuribacterales bacterium]
MRKIQFDESLAGTVVEDDFTISRFLGAGAMGSTYKARQHSLGRDVCLKFLALSSLSEAENVRRFKREARILARLKHRSIVECYSFGIFERIYPFLVMELVEGRSLRSILEDGPLDWRRSCNIVLQACEALRYAHEEGFVHRDVKPDNIMLCGDSGSEVVKLIDFGLAGKLVSTPGTKVVSKCGLHGRG